jgi:hypothetical protein
LITENLYDALRNLRTADTVVPIWIDQLSINQNDMTERASQVQLMGKIYASAEKVVIWLGNEQNDSNIAIELARTIAQAIDENGGDIVNQILDSPESFGLPRWHDKAWRTLGLLLRRPWFERTWIIQEVVKAREAIIKCGMCIITWESLSRVASAIDFETSRPSGTSGTSNGSPTHRIRFINRLRAEQPDPVDLLIGARDYRASDPRDKIYAFLGLSRFDIEANYETTTTVDLYVRFAGQYLLKALSDTHIDGKKSRKAMNLISSAGRANQQEQLPSWVPDWNMPLQTRPIVPHPLPSTDHVPGYYAGGSALSQIELLSGNRLCLSAKLYDSVAIAGTARLKIGGSMSRKQFQATMDEWMTEAMGIYSQAGPWYPTGEPKGEVFKRTLIANHDRAGRLASMDTVQRCFNGWSILSQRRGYLPLFDKERFTGDEWLYFHATMAARGRVLMLTCGGYMGLVPCGTVTGDTIGILLGGEAPVVLRPAGCSLYGLQYELIGEAYVHGWMDGEMVTEVLQDSRYQHIGTEDILLV